MISYCIIGAIVKYQYRGVRGKEVIPNYAQWKDLPFLIKVATFSTAYNKHKDFWGIFAFAISILLFLTGSIY